MSTYRVLRRLIIWDIKLQARENVYLFTLFTTWEAWSRLSGDWTDEFGLSPRSLSVEGSTG
jgi:hypothetical protein